MLFVLANYIYHFFDMCAGEGADFVVMHLKMDNASPLPPTI